LKDGQEADRDHARGIEDNAEDIAAITLIVNEHGVAIDEFKDFINQHKAGE